MDLGKIFDVSESIALIYFTWVNHCDISELKQAQNQARIINDRLNTIEKVLITILEKLNGVTNN